MAEHDLSISQLPPLTLPAQGNDLLHIARGGEDFRISRTELVKMLLSQLSDANVSGTSNGQALIFNSTTGKWSNQFVSWAIITGKPSTFTPTVHTHLWAEITDAPTDLPPSTHTHPWSELIGVPTTFPPASHGHDWDDLTDVPATFPPEIHGHWWSEITGKPTTFPPDLHDHSVLYYNKVELSISGAGGQVHWDNITDKPATFGSGDMSKSVYDLDNDGVVDTAKSVAWSGITGKPATFSPDVHTHDDRYFTESELTVSGGGGSVHWDNITNKPTVWGGDMSKTIYDQNNDGVVDAAASAPWSGIVGKPVTFPPSVHNHDDLYSLLSHNHENTYSPLSHDHDVRYSLLSHTHNYLADAPSDTKIYGRKNGAWVDVGTVNADTVDGYHASSFALAANVPILASGTYAPIVYLGSNVTTATVPGDYFYTRIGNIVTVTGALVIDAAAAGQANLSISLPIASNFSSYYDLNGNATAPTAGYPSATWYSDSINKRAVLNLYSPDGANVYWRFIMMYIVK